MAPWSHKRTRACRPRTTTRLRCCDGSCLAAHPARLGARAAALAAPRPPRVRGPAGPQSRLAAPLGCERPPPRHAAAVLDGAALEREPGPARAEIGRAHV